MKEHQKIWKSKSQNARNQWRDKPPEKFGFHRWKLLSAGAVPSLGELADWLMNVIWFSKAVNWGRLQLVHLNFPGSCFCGRWQHYFHFSCVRLINALRRKTSISLGELKGSQRQISLYLLSVQLGDDGSWWNTFPGWTFLLNQLSWLCDVILSAQTDPSDGVCPPVDPAVTLGTRCALHRSLTTFTGRTSSQFDPQTCRWASEPDSHPEETPELHFCSSFRATCLHSPSPNSRTPQHHQGDRKCVHFNSFPTNCFLILEFYRFLIRLLIALIQISCYPTIFLHPAAEVPSQISGNLTEEGVTDVLQGSIFMVATWTLRNTFPK